MENNTINKIGALIFAIVLFIVFYIGFGVYRENRIRLVEGGVQTNIDSQDKVKPDNVKPLSQETGGKVVVTLITCVNYSKNRLIVQAVAEG